MLIGPIPTILSHCKSFQWVGNTWQSLMGHLSVVKSVFLWGVSWYCTFHWLLVNCVPCLAHECGLLTTQPQYCCATVIFFFLSFLMASKFQNETTWTLRFRILTTEILKPEKPCENEPLYLSVSSLLSADCWFYWDQLKCLQSWWSVTKWMLLISLNNKTKTFTSEHQLF